MDPFEDDDQDGEVPTTDESPFEIDYENQKVVLFVDLLGFSRLTERWPVIADEFAVLDRPDREDFLRVRLESIGNNKLIEGYMHCNMAVDEAIQRKLLEDTPITAISFSDAAFVATDSIHDGITLAQSIFNRLVHEGVPVRCGIAYGSFVVLRFRSDLSLRASTHAAQFVGTGVVWSHAACELSGLKGLRIFLHPSAAALVPDDVSARPARLTIPLAPGEPSAHVARELNYLNPYKNNWDSRLWRDMQIMHVVAQRDGATASALSHYDATFDAINRMRAELHRPPMHPAEEFPVHDLRMQLHK